VGIAIGVSLVIVASVIISKRRASLLTPEGAGPARVSPQSRPIETAAAVEPTESPEAESTTSSVHGRR
jgi:hypothetical protein